MLLRYKFSEDDFIALCLKNLERDKTSVFEDIHDALIHFFSVPESFVINSFKHKYSYEYYDAHLSLKDYMDQGKLQLPYLEFELSVDKDTDLEITEVFVPDFVHLNDFQYGGGVTQKYKIKNTKLKTKSKCAIRLLTVEIPLALLTKLYSRMTPPELLLPSRLGVWEWRQTFYNKKTGESFFCSCFKAALDKHRTFQAITHDHVKRALEFKSFKDSICHICTNTNSDLMYCHKMYGSAFKARYGAYIAKHALQEDISEREAENYIRELKGVAKIGERWVNETLLFNYISLLFPDHTILREASPSWLNRQRFDVYIPELNLAIEYQGQQHYVAVDLFGGVEGLKRTKERDKEKLQLSKANGVEVIYFSYKENLSEKLVQNRLKKYLTELE